MPQEKFNSVAFFLKMIVLTALMFGTATLPMFFQAANPKTPLNDVDFWHTLEEKGYLISDLTVACNNKYPDKNISKYISADYGNLSVDFMAFEDLKSANSGYYNVVNTMSSRLIKNGEVKLESAGSKSNFQYYKLETDKKYAHIMRIENTIVAADSPIARQGEIISIVNKLGYNYDLPIDKTGYIGSKQFSDLALIFLAASFPICLLCRKLYFIKLCELCGKEPWEVKSKMAEIVGNSMSAGIRQFEFEKWVSREATDNYKAQRMMRLYGYFQFPSILFLIFSFAFRKNGTYNTVALVGMVIISLMLIYTVIFALKNKLIIKCLRRN